jgi:hypothetical protein
LAHAKSQFVLPWKYGNSCTIYAVRTDQFPGAKMRISLADSLANGFRKWSDAQRPTEQPEPPRVPETEKPKGGGTLPAATGEDPA